MKRKHRNEFFKIEQGEAQEENLVFERPCVQLSAPHKNEQNKIFTAKKIKKKKNREAKEQTVC